MQLPQQRKLSVEEMIEAGKLLSMKANKKMVQDKIGELSGKVILLKDLSNISTKSKMAKTRNSLHECIKTLTEKYGECMANAVWCMVVQYVLCVIDSKCCSLCIYYQL